MSSGGARRGRRDNGLDAAEYAAAGDVDPRVGEHLLDVLAIQGIAAYLQPAVDLNPIMRNATMPARPTDRLYVDRAHLRTARAYLAQLTSASPSVDEAWAEIVASYDAEVDAARASWPEAENVAPAALAEQDVSERDPGERDPGQSDPGEPVVERRPAPRTAQDAGEPPSLLTALDTFGAHLPDDADDTEGYTPPPPPPLPRISKYAILGVLAIVAGFVLFIKPTLLPVDPDVTMVAGFTGILAGFATLVWRLRPGDDEDDIDPDDGARV